LKFDIQNRPTISMENHPEKIVWKFEVNLMCGSLKTFFWRCRIIVLRRVQKPPLLKDLCKDLPSSLNSVVNCEAKQRLFGLVWWCSFRLNFWEKESLDYMIITWSLFPRKFALGVVEMRLIIVARWSTFYDMLLI
jgi:hypothetical protein